jgi:hypothetical protein
MECESMHRAGSLRAVGEEISKYKLFLVYLFINCNWVYARWQCYKNWTYIQKMDIHSKETKHVAHEKAARTSHEK